MAALLSSQKASGASDFQITHGNLKSGAKISKLSYGRKALFSHFF